MASKQQFRARKGELVLVEGRKLGVRSRSGSILEVLGEPGRSGGRSPRKRHGSSRHE